MKVLLVNAPRIDSIWCGVPDIFNGKDQHLFPPLGIMYLSGYIKERTRHECMIYDPNADKLEVNYTYKKMEEIMRRYQPDVVGITALTHNMVDIARTAELAKKVSKDIHVTIGGPHVVRFPEETMLMKNVDSIVVDRDAEETFGEWLDALERGSGFDQVQGVHYRDKNGEIQRNPRRPLNKNLSRLPFPDRTGLDLKKYYTPGMKGVVATTMVTSRGCPQGCHFCFANSSYGVRDAVDVVNEMEHCKKQGIEEVHFVDDIFNAPAKRVVAIADEILKRGLKMSWGFKAIVNATTREMLERAKEAGCSKAHFGVETGTPEGLKSLGKTFIKLDDSRRVFKWCRELGITSCAYIMIGTPAEKNEADIRRTIDFVYELDPDFVVYAIMSPYPDTPLWKQGADLGLWDYDLWRNFMINPVPGTEIPTTWTEHMSKEEILRIFKKVNREFYFNPRRVMRTLAQVTSWEHLLRIVRGGLAIARLQLLQPNARSI
ncbi:MAG TPA: radical SAM protein [Candidatus Nitrosotenuis sp.]|nr:radical SAM protein [Candidatus Nitrosotenuis sp.]